MKYTIFREMLDYMAHITKVTDADLNYCGDRILIEGESDGQVVTMEVIVRNKEENEDA